MTSAAQEPAAGAVPEAQRGMAEKRHADQDRTLLAMQQLEAALATAAPRRERPWLAEVRRTLTVLGEAAAEEARNAAEPDSPTLSDIARTQPWLRNRVRGLRIHYGQRCARTWTPSPDRPLTSLISASGWPGSWPACGTSGPASPT